MARPTKYNPERRRIIIESLRAGMTRFAAAGRAEVAVSQVGRWCERYASFAHECAVAEQAAAARMESIIIKAAADQDPATALQWLKRRRREDWGDNLTQKQDVAISGSMGITVGDEAIILAAEEIKRRGSGISEDAG